MNGYEVLLKPGSRVVIAALVPAAGDEDQPLLTAAVQQVSSAECAVVGILIQRRGVSRSRNPGGAQSMYRRYPMQKATLLGKGKVLELVELVLTTSADTVLFCNQLTRKQKSTLELLVGVTVLSALPRQ